MTLLALGVQFPPLLCVRKVCISLRYPGFLSQSKRMTDVSKLSIICMQVCKGWCPVID